MSDTQIDNIREVEWEFDHWDSCVICGRYRPVERDGWCFNCRREEQPAEEPDDE